MPCSLSNYPQPCLCFISLEWLYFLIIFKKIKASTQAGKWPTPLVEEDGDNRETVLTLLYKWFLPVCVTFAASLLKCPIAPVVQKESVIFSPESNHGMQMEPELGMSKASCKCPLQMPLTMMGRIEQQLYLHLHLHLHAWPTQAVVCQALNLRWNVLCNPMISCQFKSAAWDVKCRTPGEQRTDMLG